MVRNHVHHNPSVVEAVVDEGGSIEVAAAGGKAVVEGEVGTENR